MKQKLKTGLLLPLFLSLAVLSVCAVATGPFFENAISSTKTKIEKIITNIVKDLSLHASYKEASPNIFKGLVLKDAKVQGQGLYVNSKNLSFKYDFNELLKGNIVIKSIRLEDVIIDSVYSDTAKIIEKLVNTFSGQPQAENLNPQDLKIELRHIKARLDLDGIYSEATISDIDLCLNSDKTIDISSNGTVTAIDSAARYGITNLLLPYSLSANIDSKTGETVFFADAQADTDFGRLSKIRFTSRLNNDGLSVSLTPNNNLKKLDAFWNTTTERINVDLDIDSWKPSSLFKPKGFLKEYEEWFDMNCSGSVHASSDLTLEGTTLAINASALLPIVINNRKLFAQINGNGSYQDFEVKKASISNKSIYVSFAGDTRPESLEASGKMSVSYNVANDFDISSELDIFGSGSSWFVYTPAIKGAEDSLEDVTISVDLKENNIYSYIDAALPLKNEDDFSATNERLSLEGLLQLGEDPFVEAVIKLGTLQLSSFNSVISKLVGSNVADFLSPISLRGDVSLYSDMKSLSYNSSGLLVVYDGDVTGFGTLRFSGGLKNIDIDNIDATLAGYSVTGSASFDLGDTEKLVFGADIAVQGVPYELVGDVENNAIVVSGDYGLKFSAKTVEEKLGIALSVEEMPIPILETVSFLSLSSEGSFVSSDNWNLTIDNFNLSQPGGEEKELPSIMLSAALNNEGGKFSNISFSDKYSKLQGSIDVTWLIAKRFQVSMNGNMSGQNNEKYSVTGTYATGGDLDLSASVTKAPVARFGLNTIKGVFDSNIKVTGNPSSPIANFDFILNEGQRSKDMIFAAGLGSYNDSMINISDARIRFQTYSATDLSFSYNIKNASADLKANLDIVLGANVIKGGLVASSSSNNAQEKTSSNDSLFNNYTVKGNIQDAVWKTSSLGNVPFSVSLLEGATDIVIGPNNEIGLSISNENKIEAYISENMPLSLKASGLLGEDSINLAVKDITMDSPFLFDIIGLSMVQSQEGKISGYLNFTGKLSDPDINGVATVDNMYISMPDYVPVPIGPFTEPVYFTGRTMEINQPEANCGDAKVSFNLSANIFSYLPESIDLAVKTISTESVPVSTKLLGLNIDGYARPDLQISVQSDKTTIDGNVYMDKGDVVLSLDMLSKSKGESSNYGIAGSLDLTFGKLVSVYFPGKRLPILYGQTDPSSHLVVSFDSSLGEFSLDGTTILRGGTVFYIQRNFYLKNASIVFNESQNQFDPKINATAERRMASDSGTVIITLRATDARLSNLTFKLESSPAMTETEISQLMGQSLFAEEDGEIDVAKALIDNSDLALSPELNILNSVERGLQNVLGLDLFVLRTKVVQRWLYDVSSGWAGSDKNMSLADYLEDTAIVAGKYIGDRLFLQGMLTFGSDMLEHGGNLRLDSEISMEWVTPHFTLNWKIKPNNLDTLFIENQEFSFMWNIPLK